MRMFLGASLLIVVVIAFWSFSTPSAVAGQQLRLNIQSEPPTLNPAQARDSVSGNVLRMLFEGLTRIGPQQDIRLAAAKSVDVSPDKRVYRFYLRHTQWSNGDPVCAQDFAYSWRLRLDPAFPSSYAYQFYVIKNARAAREGKVSQQEVGIRVIDDKTLEVELENPTPYFLELTASYPFFPLNEKHSQKFPHWAEEGGPCFVSNGPFELQSWKHDNEIVVKKHGGYWDADEVKLDRIQISIVEDSSTELDLFEKGAIDWAGKPLSSGLPSDAIPALKEQGRLQIQQMLATYFLEVNTTIFPLSYPKIRRALAYAIDRRSIVDHITQANEEIALGLVPPELEHPIQNPIEDHDIEQARQLFSEALGELGLKVDELPPLTISYNSHESHHKVAQVLQEQWRDAFGLEVRLQNSEWKVYLDQLNKGAFDVGRVAWFGDFRDPITFLDLYKYAEDAGNHTRWSHPAYSRLLDQASQSTDEAERWDLLVRAETLLMQEMPIIPIFHPTISYLINSRPQGVVLSSLGDIDFRWAYFEDFEF